MIENSYDGEKWTLEDRSLINSSVVTAHATPGSPLAAISYKYDGLTYRQVFFVGPTGFIMAAYSNSTSHGGIASGWSVSRAISLDTVAPDSIGLAACWSDGLENGISVFYPSSATRTIQEVKWTFGAPSWEEGETFHGSDPSSGVGCAAKNNENQYMNVYMRWKSSSAVKQVFYNYKEPDNGWDYGGIYKEMLALYVCGRC